MAIGERIYEVRKKRLALTQRELADQLITRDGRHPDQVNVSRWERGEAEPSPRYVRQIAAMAELPVAWFYSEDGVAA